jgi:hypothetical protein
MSFRDLRSFTDRFFVARLVAFFLAIRSPLMGGWLTAAGSLGAENVAGDCGVSRGLSSGRDVSETEFISGDLRAVAQALDRRPAEPVGFADRWEVYFLAVRALMPIPT